MVETGQRFKDFTITTKDKHGNKIISTWSLSAEITPYDFIWKEGKTVKFDRKPRWINAFLNTFKTKMKNETITRDLPKSLLGITGEHSIVSHMSRHKTLVRKEARKITGVKRIKLVGMLDFAT